MTEKLNIIYEDNHIIVVEKQAGILTQGDYSGEISLLDLVKSYIKKQYNKPGEAFAGLVHRLDKSVSGVLVFARTSKAAARLQKEFQRGDIKKFYIAITETRENMPNQRGWITLSNHILRVGDKTIVETKENPHTEKALLQYKIIKSNKEFSLLLINLITGKKHQIRAQLASAGFPIVGDKKYGSTISEKSGICLHAIFLSLLHPTKKERISFYCPPPGIFKKFLDIDNLTPEEEIKKHIEEILEAK